MLMWQISKHVLYSHCFSKMFCKLINWIFISALIEYFWKIPSKPTFFVKIWWHFFIWHQTYVSTLVESIFFCLNLAYLANILAISVNLSKCCQLYTFVYCPLFKNLITISIFYSHWIIPLKLLFMTHSDPKWPTNKFFSSMRPSLSVSSYLKL